MGAWEVDVTSEPGILRLRFVGTLTVAEMMEFVEAHNRAVDGFEGRDYKVWSDMSAMEPLPADVARLMEQTKGYSRSRPNFRGSSVLVRSGTVVLQHRHTSIRGGVMNTELISDDVATLKEHLRTVWRTTP